MRSLAETKALASYLESSRSAVLASIELALAGLLTADDFDLAEHWLDYQVDFPRGQGGRAREWAAGLLEQMRRRGAGPHQILDVIHTLHGAAAEACLGKVAELTDGDIWRLFYDAEKVILQHAGDFYAELEQKTAAMKLRREKAIADSMHTAFAIVDSDGVLLLVNTYLANLFGVTEERLTGQNLLTLCDGDAATALRRGLRPKRGASSPESFAGVVLTPHGRLPLRFWSLPLFDEVGFRTGLALTMAREDELGGAADDAYPARLIEHVAECLGLGFYLVDNAQRVVAANGLALDFVKPGQEDPLPQTYKPATDCETRERTPGLERVQVNGPAGDLRWLELACIPLRDAHGAVSHAAKLLRDVTEQKLIEDQFLRQQRSSLMTQLSVAVAHQLRNPLGVMIGLAEMMNEGMPADKARSVAEKILRNGIRCKEIVENLLEFGRTTREEYIVLNVNDLVRERVQPMYTGPQYAQLSWDLDHAVDPVVCSPDQLVLVLVHLIDYMLETAASHVRLSTAREEESAVIRLSNDGPGIPEEHQRHMFDPSFLNPSAESGQMLALGLSRRIIEEHGGQLHFTAPAEGGACLALELPIQGSVALTTPSAHASPEKAPPPRILVVEDEADQLFLLGLALQTKGYEVDSATSGTEASALLDRNEYDAAVLDILLEEGFGGRDLYAIMLEAHPRLAQHTLFITGDTMKYETRRFLQNSNRPHLEKPFLIADFTAGVKKMLEEPKKGARNKKDPQAP